MTSRTIQKTSGRARNDAAEILEFFFATELLRPSACVWVVSPWLSDVPVLDNSHGGYESVVPSLPRTPLRLSRVLAHLAAQGTHIVLATRRGDYATAIGEGLAGHLSEHQLTIRRDDDLHTKGIVGANACITGSMNFTHNGLESLTEVVTLETSPQRVASIRLEFLRLYGGVSD